MAAHDDRGRIVTMVFSDLAGSTALGERLDPETLRRVLGGYFDEMRAVLTSHGGVIEKIIGDAIVAVFDSERSEREGAERAVRAVADTLAALDVLNDVIEARWGVRLANRTGIATGRITVERLEAGHSVLGGAVVARAESMERASPHLESLMDEATWRLVEPIVHVETVEPVPLAGTTATVPAFRLVAVAADDTVGPRSRIEACGGCGEPMDPGASRCPACGAYRRFSSDTRRTVTVVFADPKVSPVPGTEPDATAMTAALSRFFDTVRPVLEAHGATVETFIGDAVMAVFGLPVRREDDALRAVRAAADIRGRLGGLNEMLEAEFGVRVGCPMGVNSGEVVAGDAATGQRLVTGDVVNVAARLEQSAGEGEILIGDLTRRLAGATIATTSVEPLTLKGKSEPVPAHRLDRIDGPGDRPGRRQLPMVGRQAELGVLASTYDEACATRSARVVTVTGDAGSGKTTLIMEFADRIRSEGAGMLSGRCLSYGDGITFWPVVEMVRGHAGIVDDDSPGVAFDKIARVVGGDTDVAERLASLMGYVEGTFPVSEIFWATRRMVELASADSPLVVVFEDVHWAEQTLLDLIDHLAGTVDRAPVLVVCGARLALRERFPDWAEGTGAVIDLAPLTDAEIAEVVDNTIGGAQLPDDARLRVAAAAEGNPLFVEQLLSMLMDDGHLRFDGDRWVVEGDLSALAIPPTIHALLASRIDRLTPAARQVAEPASVIGRTFAAAAVRTMVADRAVAETLTDRLAQLLERQIIRAGEHAADVGEMYFFHHALLRDAAYQGLLKETRAVFHEEFVKWADVVNAAAGRSQEFEEILGFHLEQAFTYWSELGSVDDRVVALGRDGSHRLANAGGRAFTRGDMPAAATLLWRAASLLGSDDPSLPMLLLRSGEARLERGDFTGAVEAVERAVATADAVGDRGVATAAEIERLRFAFSAGVAESAAAVQAAAAELLATAEELRHEAAQARAWRLLTMLEVVAARFGPAESAALEMVEHARRAGDPVMEMRIMQNLAVLAPVGPTPVPEAIARCTEVLDLVAADRRAAANTKRPLASLHAMAGDLGTARRLFAEARAALTDLGWAYDAALVSLDSGPAELLAGDPHRAEAELRADTATLREMGDTFFLPTTLVFLAEALVRQDRFDEAERCATECAETADPDDLAPQVLWRSVQAVVEAARGADDDALRLAHEAVRLSEGSDGPTLRADALRSLAVVGRRCGDEALALGAARAAADAYRNKGSTAGVAAVQADFAGV